MNKTEVLASLQTEFDEVAKTANAFSEEQFYISLIPNKWSAAQIMEHLFLSVKPLAGLFSSPQVMIEKWGKNTRATRNYDQIVSALREKLDNGVGFQWNPIDLATEPTKGEQIIKFDIINEKFLERAALFTDEELDSYQLPHPLIGLLSVREFLDFTLYHNRRHHIMLKKLLEMSKGIS
ncbi:MAG TPA: DinB family protein [Bacteroidia bacterium]|jgi:hypothetical protein|nr:DinB family protein [Bacteroidia bacterium]